MASSDDEGPSIMEIIGKLWQAFEHKIKAEGLEHAKGLLVAAAALLCLNISVLICLNMPGLSSNFLSMGILLVFITILALIPVLLLFTYVIIPLYLAMYGEHKHVMTTVLLYQIAVLFIAIAISLGSLSLPIAASGLIVFGIVAFVYPLVRTIATNGTDIEQINKTVNLALKAIVLISAIVQLIVGFAHLI